MYVAFILKVSQLAVVKKSIIVIGQAYLPAGAALECWAGSNKFMGKYFKLHN